MVRLHTLAGPVQAMLPAAARAGHATATFPIAAMPDLPALAATVFTDAIATTPGEDPTGMLARLAAFWRAGPPALPAPAPGEAVPVADRFLRVADPWPHPLAAACAPGAVCPPPPPLAAWMIGLPASALASPMLAAGEGRLHHELRATAPGLLPTDVYTIAAGPWRPILSARLAGPPGLFLCAAPSPQPDDPVPLATLRALAAALADLFTRLGAAER